MPSNVEQIAKYLRNSQKKAKPGDSTMPINPLQSMVGGSAQMQSAAPPRTVAPPVNQGVQQGTQQNFQKFLGQFPKKPVKGVIGGPAKIQSGNLFEHRDRLNQMNSDQKYPGQLPKMPTGTIGGMDQFKKIMEQMRQKPVQGVSGGPAKIQSGNLFEHHDKLEQMNSDQKYPGQLPQPPATGASGMDQFKKALEQMQATEGGQMPEQMPDYSKVFSQMGDSASAVQGRLPELQSAAGQQGGVPPRNIHPPAPGVMTGTTMNSSYTPTDAASMVYYGNAADIGVAKSAGVTGKFVDISKLSYEDQVKALSSGGVVLGGGAGGVNEKLWNAAVTNGANLTRIGGANRDETIEMLRDYQKQNEFAMPDVTERYSGNRTYYGNAADIDLAKQSGVQGKFVNVEGMDRNQLFELLSAGGVVLGGAAGGINERDFQRAVETGADLTRVGGKDRDETLKLMKQYQKDANLQRSLDQVTDLISDPFKYDPEDDVVYKAMMMLAQKQAGTASKEAMEAMNDRGIMNSSMMGERLGQIQQGASDAVIGAIPQLAQNAQNQHNTQVSQVMGLQQALQGQANNERDFNESRDRWYDEFTTAKDQWNKEFQESHNRWDAEFDQSNYRWSKEFKDDYNRWSKEFKEDAKRWNAEFDESSSRWNQEFGLNQDQFNWDKYTWGEEFDESNRRYDQDFNFQYDQFEFTKGQTAIENAFKSRGYDLQELAQQDDAAYKSYLMDIGLSEQEAKKATSQMVASLSKFDNPDDAFEFIGKQANNIADGGVDMRTVYDAMDVLFGSSGGSSGGGGGYGSGNFSSKGKGGGWIPNTSDGKYKVTSEYGNRKDPFSGKTANHGGTDIALPTGTKLSSNVQGTVVYSGWGKSGTGYGNYGNVVAIKDFKGNVHLYAHLEGVNVKNGQKVSAGDLIGTSGSSGKSTGPHLHYEVRKNGDLNSKMDPSPYLKGGFSGTNISSYRGTNTSTGSATTRFSGSTVRNGSRGSDVKVLQKALGISSDGIFGPKTESAVRSFQRKNGLTVDGVVGPQTWNALMGRSSSKSDPYALNSRQQRQAGGSYMGSGSTKAPSSVAKYVSSAASKYKVSSGLITAVMKAESNFNPKAQSGAGAYGLMQLMPLWGSGRYDPQTNVNIGTNFLRDNLKKYPDVRLALAAYNWGPGNVDKAIKKAGKKSYAAIEKYLPAETKKYVPKVLGYL